MIIIFYSRIIFNLLDNVNPTSIPTQTTIKELDNNNVYIISENSLTTKEQNFDNFDNSTKIQKKHHSKKK